MAFQIATLLFRPKKNTHITLWHFDKQLEGIINVDLCKYSPYESKLKTHSTKNGKRNKKWHFILIVIHRLKVQKIEFLLLKQQKTDPNLAVTHYNTN